ncbi:DUF551 domain-containing protein [Salmonella enterica]|nr:DUF551 domain-containing protein [Salmonella enterica]
MIDKYRLEDMRRESGEKGYLARWVIQLQADLDREIRKSASERAMLSRLAVIMHGSETDLNLLTVTAQSLMDRCKASNSPVTPDSWIPARERVPEESGRYWCYVEEQNSLGKSHYQWNCSWNGEAWSDKALSGRVTHWMPLPAAPQHEVKP